MINKIKYLFVTGLVFVTISCNDWLELFPPGELIRSEYWQTKLDVEAVLMSSYRSFGNMDEKLFVLGEVRADMIIGDINQAINEERLMESNIYPDNDFSNWEDFYKVINYANEVIKNAPLVQEVDDTFTDFEMQSLRAEAYFVRSLTYFYLVRLYRDVPLVLEPTETDDAEIYVPKSTEDQVLGQIVADLEANYDFAPAGGFTTVAENKGRASKAAFDALLADIALWQYRYDDAIRYVERIENVENQEIVLMPGGRWFEIFYPGNSLESIFEFQFDGELQQYNGTFSMTYVNSNRYDPSQKAIEFFAYEFGGQELVRGEEKSIAQYPPGDEDFHIWKYVGRAPDGQSLRSGLELQSANWIVYRLADVLLMKAEALSQRGDYQQAQDILNEIRARAGLNPVAIASNPVAFEDAILEERAKELAYEGKRWFDLLRMGRRNNYARRTNLINIIISNVPSTQKRILAAKLNNPLGWYLPVFDEELERNNQMTQNPYYDN